MLYNTITVVFMNGEMICDPYERKRRAAPGLKGRAGSRGTRRTTAREYCGGYTCTSRTHSWNTWNNNTSKSFTSTEFFYT